MTTEHFTDRIVFLDVETVCLDPAPGSIWEVAVMTTDDDMPRVVQVRPDLAIATPEALVVGRFADRYQAAETLHDLYSWLLDNMPQGAVIVGSNPQFDIAHLTAYWDHYGGPASAPWHYHPCDLPSLVAGVTGRWPDGDGSLSLRWAAEVMGIEPYDYETHTAAGDVLLARDIWRAVKCDAADGQYRPTFGPSHDHPASQGPA